MKFKVYYTSDWRREERKEVEFNSLEEFMAWVESMNFDVKKQVNYDGIIIHPPLKDKEGNRVDNEWELEIYDDWRE